MIGKVLMLEIKIKKTSLFLAKEVTHISIIKMLEDIRPRYLKILKVLNFITKARISMAKVNFHNNTIFHMR